MHADAHVHRWGSIGGEVAVQRLQTVLDGQAGLDCIEGIGLGTPAQGGAEHRQEAVAGELVHHASPLGDRGHAQGHAAVEPGEQVCRAELLGYGREVARVGEHDRHRQHPAFEAAVIEQVFPLFPQLLRHRRRGGLAQQPLDLLALPLAGGAAAKPGGPGHQRQSRQRQARLHPDPLQQQAHGGGQCHHLHGRHREDAAPHGGEALPERHAKSQSYQQQQGATPAR